MPMPTHALVATAAVLYLTLGRCLGGEPVARLDLLKHDPADKADIRMVENGVYEWSLPDGLGQTLHFDLATLGIDPKEYDEFRFEIKPEGSQVALHTVLQGFPEKKDLSSWYLKFKTVTGQWSEGRYDLRVDDDGVLGGNSPGTAGRYGLLQFTLERRVIGFLGEPAWRKAQIRAPRLVTYPVAASFDMLETDIQAGADEIAYVYSLHVENRTDKPVSAKLDADSTQSLKRFQVAAPAAIALAPREKKSVSIRVFISRPTAMALPALYAEPVFPKLWIEGVVDSDVTPLMGYRRWPMWGVVPIFNRVWWTPALMRTHLEARQALIPGIDAWVASVTNAAEAALNVDWPTPPLELLPPGYDQSYVCKDCNGALKPAEPTAFRKHVCPKCKKIFENDPAIDKHFIPHYLAARFGNIRTLALAYQLTGREAYAKKAVQMLLAYAELFPSMPVTGMRSTCGGCKLARNTLHSCYLLPVLAEAYAWLHEAPCLDAASRLRIERFLNDEASRDARHSTEYTNQTMEHLRAYGSVGLATGFWPLAAEAIQGEFGWHEMVEYAFSDEGITDEAGSYQNSIFIALNRFAGFAYDQGVTNLLTARLKRVYDGMLPTIDKNPLYELAYRVYRDPAYVRVLTNTATEPRILRGVLEIPRADRLAMTSVLMPATGYIYLRRGNASDYREIRLNYIKTFDRGEFDKFATFFFRNGQPADWSVGRISYGIPTSYQNMAATAAHNALVVDGLNEKPVNGRLVAFDASPDAPLAVVATDPLTPFYDGVTQVRGVALVANAYVVFDRVSADKPRTIDRFQYGQGKASLQFKTTASETPFTTPPALAVFRNVEGGPCGKDARIDYGNNLKMRLVSDTDLVGYKAVTVGTWEAQPTDLTFVRATNATAVTFLAAFTDEKDAEPPALRIRISTPEKLVLEVETPALTQIVTVDIGAKKATVSAAKR